ncbi:MAG: ATP-dependent helicase [Candidatus Thermoplasmatota archaeon]|nr:ATP-dependent helicase [Candidatus Thermoplasmatota archaeon]
MRTRKSSASTARVLSLMHPIIAEWFKSRFTEVTEAQAMAVPLIHSREGVLVSSPTGSGKTLTAFMAILNELTLMAEKEKLEDRVYAVYVSPLKALANDINANLIRPLDEISELFRSKGRPVPRIRVGVRTGDTLPNERQKQLRLPPHIFITTPESLSLVLSTPVFRKKFEQVSYVIVDEVHELCDSKRGVALSLAIEKLRSICPKDFVRIGLSATVAPIQEVADFLAGVEGGKPRAIKIIEVYRQRSLDLQVLCPASDMTSLSFEVVNSKMYDVLKDMIDSHKTTLVFTNTRSGTESVVYKLKERGLENVGAHHGSLSRETRLEVEERLRRGELKAVVSSTSLELGIDIGSVDLVVQIGSPKSVAKGLQRIGRAGHQYGGTSKGRMLVFDNDDLVECAVLSRAAHKKLIDRVSIPVNSLDVLAQMIVGLSLDRPWTVDEAFSLITRSYCYRTLSIDQMRSVVKYLAGKDDFEGVYSKIWYDVSTDTFGKKRGSRMIFYLNQGTIPEEADYKIYSERGAPIGSLSEKFVERLSVGDIFVLGGRSYEFVRAKGTKAFVKSASGRKPTVPSWTGETLPRSFDLSVLIGKFRGEFEERLGRDSDDMISKWIMDEFMVDEGSATTIISYFREQKMVAKLPTDDRLVIEGYIDPSGNRNAIFHFPFGRRVNDALSRSYAWVLSKKLGCNVTVSVTDDCFMLTAPRDFKLDGIERLLSSRDIEDILREAVKDSELFHHRFRHTATRSFMVLRNYKGRQMSVARQQLRSQRLLDALHELSDFPVMSETYSEILTEVMDLEHAREVLSTIEGGTRSVEYIQFSGVPSPLAHNVILIGVSDIVLMEDRSMLLRDLHRKVLARVLGDDALSEYTFDADTVAEYFDAKFPCIRTKHDILDALRLVGPMNLFKEKGENIYTRSKGDFDALHSWSTELLRDGKVRSVWIGEDVYVHSADWSLYSSLHSRPRTPSVVDRALMDELSDGPLDISMLIERLDLGKDDVKDIVKRLEIANLVHRSGIRGGRFQYSLSTHDPVEIDDCAREAVMRHLAYHAPLSIEDIAYEVGTSEEATEKALRSLLAKELVVSGRFVIGEQQQFMLARDYLALLSKERPVFDRETVRSYVESKLLGDIHSAREFFDRFGDVGMPYDIAVRVRGFSIEEFGGMRDRGEVVLGRFVRGRLRYVLAEEAQYYLGVFRKGRLSKYESAILKAAERLGPGTYQEIAEAANIPGEVMREHFESLDRKGYFFRMFDGSDVWTSRNVYAVCTVEPEVDGAFELVLSKYVRGYGPVTAFQAASHLDIEVDAARALLRKIGAEPITVGLEQTEMFVMKDELSDIGKRRGADTRVRVLSLYDPFLGDRWVEVTSKYGEGWIFPVIHNGQVAGMVEEWLMAGAIDIRDIRLDDRSLLGPLLDELDGVMEFYRSINVDIIRVKRAFGSDVMELDAEVLKEFHGHGYRASNGMLVKGSLVMDCHERSELLDVVFSLQHWNDREILDDMSAALAKYGGLRSNSEALIRVDGFVPLKILLKKGLVVRGRLVPDRVGYCTKDDASVYRAARSRDLTQAEKLILRIVKDQQPIRRDRALTISPLGAEDTIEALKSLYYSSVLYLDTSNGYVAAPRTRLSRRSAWVRIITRMFQSYGICTAEALSTMIGSEIPMRELRRILRFLEAEGILVKGHLLRGSTTLYWATEEAHALLGKAESHAPVVISPEDNIVGYLRANFRDSLPETGRYAVYSGSNLIGSFVGRVEQSKLAVEDLQGDEGCSEIIESFAKRLGVALADREEGRLSEWEIMEFYRKSHPGMG